MRGRRRRAGQRCQRGGYHLLAVTVAAVDRGLGDARTVSPLSPSFKVAALSAKFLMAVRRAALMTVDQFAKGIFYHARELNDRFTTVFT
jgi:hypothetical protein